MAGTTGNSSLLSPWADTDGIASAVTGMASSTAARAATFPAQGGCARRTLQLVILALLAEKPAHGYELIKIIEERSDGFNTPSPGVIYPALTYLEEVGHSSVAQDGGRKLYSITPQGEAHLAENRATAEAILQALSRIGRRMDEVREAFAASATSMRMRPTNCIVRATTSSARCAPAAR